MRARVCRPFGLKGCPSYPAGLTMAHGCVRAFAYSRVFAEGARVCSARVYNIRVHLLCMRAARQRRSVGQPHAVRTTNVSDGGKKPATSNSLLLHSTPSRPQALQFICQAYGTYLWRAAARRSHSEPRISLASAVLLSAAAESTAVEAVSLPPAATSAERATTMESTAG